MGADGTTIDTDTALEKYYYRNTTLGNISIGVVSHQVVSEETEEIMYRYWTLMATKAEIVPVLDYSLCMSQYLFMFATVTSL